ncbi:hypothetical protein DACRYDRAFT_20713 [Dacryopinax primogenitus]|uniref:Uncharacterized protein n=1 Tax=Dacryopinax primogenitus (strain DJM 731) TaxID=1858805 RepID=M5GCS7_DACPD|nr:uncharacterized protein DACRYDRAFT_20713 [Dacryopinax primogenitus]EJU04037.1 hypothetical protein DACRYDRAFT_20713 [Dacryopinax primogenitus]
MDGEKLETPVADVGGEMFAGVGIFGGVAERRGILQRSPSDPQHGKNLRFEVNGEGSDVSGASGGPGAGRSRERPRGGSLSSGGSASASLSASASVFGLTGVEPTNLDEARELVHETQRAILASFDMDASGAASGSAPGTGMTLEHQLAMYGETLAIEREFARREEKERERRQREEDRQRRRLEKELGFGGRRGSEGSVGLGLGFSLGSVGGMGKGSTVLLSYDPPPWLLDDIAARRAAQGLEGGEATPPTPPEDGRPAENGNRSATANGQADGTNRLSPPAHQYRHRPPALSLSSSGSSTRPRRPPHRRAMSSSSRSGSGYGSVMEEPEDYPLPWGNTVRRNAYHPTSEAHSRSQSNDSNGLNTSGPEIVHTGPTPVSSPGTATSTQPNSASTESSTKTETHGNYAHRIWDTPPYSSIPTGLYDRDKPLSEVRGLVESPSEMTLVARKLSKTPPAGQEFTPEGTVSPQSDTGPGRRFGGLGIRGFVQTLTGR